VTDKPTSAKLAEVAFVEAFGTPETRKVAVKTNATMGDGAIERLIAAFEDAAQIDDAGNEYWDARDLARLLDYSDYRNFLNIVSKAKKACETTGQPIEDHFVDATEMVEIGSGAARQVDTIKLTRYACYLIAQNGDPAKQPVAFAQTYFAIQARRQEIQDDDVAQFVPLPEDEKRLILRHEIKEHNKNLASAAKGAGVPTFSARAATVPRFTPVMRDTARTPRPSQRAAMTSICFSRGRMFMGPIHVWEGPKGTLEKPL